MRRDAGELNLFMDVIYSSDDYFPFFPRSSDPEAATINSTMFGNAAGTFIHKLPIIMFLILCRVRDYDRTITQWQNKCTSGRYSHIHHWSVNSWWSFYSSHSYNICISLLMLFYLSGICSCCPSWSSSYFQ